MDTYTSMISRTVISQLEHLIAKSILDFLYEYYALSLSLSLSLFYLFIYFLFLRTRVGGSVVKGPPVAGTQSPVTWPTEPVGTLIVDAFYFRKLLCLLPVVKNMSNYQMVPVCCGYACWVSWITFWFYFYSYSLLLFFFNRTHSLNMHFTFVSLQDSRQWFRSKEQYYRFCRV